MESDRKENENIVMRQKVLSELDALNLNLPQETPSPADLVRQDRDGITRDGRLR